MRGRMFSRIMVVALTLAMGLGMFATTVSADITPDVP